MPPWRSLPTRRSNGKQPAPRAAAAATASAANPADKATISQAARDLAAGESKSGGAYDFTHISPNAMLKTINSLIKSGRMSLDESSSLVALMPISPLTNASGGIGVPDAADQPMNFLAALKELMAFNKSIHNDAAVAYDQKALSALERLQG
jgi:hypothetical protein